MSDIKTLVIEDDDNYSKFEIQLLSSVNEPKFILERAAKLGDAKKLLAHGNFELVILDLFLPDSSGLDTLIQIHQSFPMVSIVVLTGIGDEQFGLKAIKEGADDYLVKDQLNQSLFSRVLLYAIERKKNEVLRLKMFEAEKKAHEEAEHVIRVRDEFLLIAGHELKTPLSSLKLHIQLFEKNLRQTIATETDRFKSLINMSANINLDIVRFSNLINSLMELSQFQSGKISLKKEFFNLTTLVNEVFKSLENELLAAECNVRIDGDLEVTGIWDHVRFEEVLINLIMNAIKYAPHSQLVLTIKSDGDNARLEVQDNGSGISDEFKLKIFNRFERDTKEKGILGLGLGLYIVQQIIHFHGGTISVESKLGVGTNFIIKVPKMHTI